MAAGAPDRPFPLGPFTKGVNNRADETSVPRGALREATNVDITSAGNLRTRNGTTRVVSGQSMHSLWAHPQFPYALAVDNNALKAYDTNFDLFAVIRTGLKPAQPLSYAEVNGEIYWSNEFDSGKLGLDLIDHPFALAGPTGSPNLAATTGALVAGSYQVAITFLSVTGEESGSTLASLITVSANGGIVVSQIPQPTDARVALIRIYAASANDDTLHWYRDIPVGMTSVTIGVIVQVGKLLETQWLSPSPPGQLVRYYNGRLLVAAGNVLWYGEQYRYGQVRRSQNFVTFDSRITLLEPVGQGDEGGLFVAAGKRTYWLPGANPKKDMQQKIAHPFGAVFGTGMSVPGWYFDPQLKSECAFWMDAQGVPILGLVGGSIRALSGTYVAPIADSGSSLIRDINGIRSVIANLRGAAANSARTTDQMVATVTRNGIVV